jgi:hypothetical protein
MEQQQVLVTAINSISWLMHKSILKPIQQNPWQVTSVTKLLLPEELPHAFHHLLVRGKRRLAQVFNLTVTVSLS